MAETASPARPGVIRSAPDPAPLVASSRIQNMMQRRSEFASQREFEIEASKDHWSELETTDMAAPALAHIDVDVVSKTQHFQILGRFRRTLCRLLFCWHCANCGAIACGAFKSLHHQQHQQHQQHQHQQQHQQQQHQQQQHHQQQQGHQQQQQGSSLECVELEEADDSDAEETNREIFERVKKQWGGAFFSSKWGDILELGPKIAEGGQAEIFDVEGGMDGAMIRMDEFVVKAFKKGYSLRSLQTQWPVQFNLVNSAIIFAGTVLKDDRFAFVMYKYWGDLRKLIDVRMMEHRNSHGLPPFQEPQAVSIMLQIAMGMERLHKKRIVHRDLKASNVLVATLNPRGANSEFSCAIADYECSAGVVGTGFWRAPEVLAAVVKCRQQFKQSSELASSVFTDKADVYSFAMTCYEVLTGCVPFEDHVDAAAADCDAVVLRGCRPQLPHPMNSRVTELLCRCWHSNPLERPSFSDVVLVLETVKRAAPLSQTSQTPPPQTPLRTLQTPQTSQTP